MDSSHRLNSDRHGDYATPHDAEYQPGYTGPNDQHLLNEAEELTPEESQGAIQPRTYNLEQRPWYKRKRFWCGCGGVTLLLIVALILIIIFVVFPKMAASSIDKADMKFRSIQIRNPTDDTVDMTMDAEMLNTGPFSADVKFTEPVQVLWKNLPLGTVDMEPLSISGGSGRLRQTSTFRITSQENFGKFAQAMMKEPEFQWTLKTTLHVSAMGLSRGGIPMDKTVTMQGMGGFKDVEVLDFDLPGDHPDGGIQLNLRARISNPSPIGVSLGRLQMDVMYGDTYVGPVEVANAVVQPGDTELTMEGRMIPQIDEADLERMSDLMTRFVGGQELATEARGVAVMPDGVHPVGWLTEGIRGMVMQVGLKMPNQMDFIRGIDIQEMDMDISPETAYNPLTSSNRVVAETNLPFGFTIDVHEVRQSMNLMNDGKTLASMSIPFTPALESDMKNGVLAFALPASELRVPDDGHGEFDKFIQKLTMAKEADFDIEGEADVRAETPIGLVQLSGIKFTVKTSMEGMEGLSSVPTKIESFEVTGGTKDAMLLDIDVSLINPSRVQIHTGDVHFLMLYEGDRVGKVTLPDLTLHRRDNQIKARAEFDPNASPKGKKMLSEFMTGDAGTVEISGFEGSSAVPSLNSGMSLVKLASAMPGLDAQLVEGASFTVLDDTVKTHVAHAGVTILNPFKADLSILKIQSKINAHGAYLGELDVDLTSNPFVIPGKSKQPSPDLPFKMNLEPEAVVGLLLTSAGQANLDITPLKALLAIGGLGGETTDVDTIDPTLFDNWSMTEFIEKAMGALTVDVTIATVAKVGDYETSLDLVQRGVGCNVDSSIGRLIPIVGGPIVAQMVGKATMEFDRLFITNPTNDGFEVIMNGAIRGTGPLPATIDFIKPVLVKWGEIVLGEMTMGQVQAVPRVGAVLDNHRGQFRILDMDAMAMFTGEMLNGDGFEWTIEVPEVTVSALGAKFEGISMTKSVSLGGMRGFDGQVDIRGFDLPANDPAGGIQLKIDTALGNPSNIGVELGDLTFDIYDEASGVLVGPVVAQGVSLQPKAESLLHMTGRMVPQPTPEGIAALSALMNRYLGGEDNVMRAQGRGSRTPSGESPEWLNAALNNMALTVTLPGQPALDLIRSLTLTQLGIAFTPDTAYAPVSSSTGIEAGFEMPFGFPLEIIRMRQSVQVYLGETHLADMEIPWTDATTDVAAHTVNMAFSGVPMAVRPEAHGAFDQFVQTLTLEDAAAIGMRGAAAVVAKTAIGDLDLSGIQFRVDDISLQGMNGFASVPMSITKMDVTGGTPEAMIIDIEVVLTNPSNVDISIAGDTRFDMFFDGAQVGRVVLPDLTLHADNNTVTGRVYFAPKGEAGKAAGSNLLGAYMANAGSKVQIAGGNPATDIASLNLGMSQVRLESEMPGLDGELLRSTRFTVTDETLKTGIAEAGFELNNPFAASLAILTMDAQVIYRGMEVGSIKVDLTKNPLKVEGHSVLVSPDLPFKMNLETSTIVGLIKGSAEDSNVDLGPLNELLALLTDEPADTESDDDASATLPTARPATLVRRDRGIAPTSPSAMDYPSPPHTPTAEKKPRDDPISRIILAALANLKVELTLKTDVKVGDYATSMVMKQDGIGCETNDSVLRLINLIGQPIVKRMVGGAAMEIDAAFISQIRPDRFMLRMQGRVSGTGPVDAEITFPTGVKVSWEDSDGRSVQLGTLMLPTLNSVAHQGATLDHDAEFLISDERVFAGFTKQMLAAERFAWTVEARDVSVLAIGNEFNDVELIKPIELVGFDGLKETSVEGFDLPGDHPEGGIMLDIKASFRNPSNIGIELGAVTFEPRYQDTPLGLVTVHDLVMRPGETAQMTMSGRMAPQSGAEDLARVSDLMSRFIAGHDVPVTVQGRSAQAAGPAAGELLQVGWLDAAFGQLNLAIALPGSEGMDIIDGINMEDMSLEFTPETAYAPRVSSKDIAAGYRNPFGFTLGIQQIKEEIVLLSENGRVPMASLDLPMQPVVGDDHIIHTAFENATMQVLDNAHGVFDQFVADLTVKSSQAVIFGGTVDTVAQTPIGEVSLTGIPLNAKTTLEGLNGLKDVPTKVLRVDVTGGNRDYLSIELVVLMTNPSKIQIATRGYIQFEVGVPGKSGTLGQAILRDLQLAHGENEVTASFRFRPNPPSLGADFLSRYLGGAPEIPVVIGGAADSTNIPSLRSAFSSLQLASTIAGNTEKLLVECRAKVPLLTVLWNGKVSAEVVVHNPFQADLHVLEITTRVTYNGKVMCEVADMPMENFRIAGGGDDVSPTLTMAIDPKFSKLSLAGKTEILADVTFSGKAVVGESPETGYPLTVDYVQSAVKVKISFGLWK
ncbi:hypothetical protein IWQ60_006039 [Tieghemiomyces parasiticus]|uniref:Uncharacterized protein n=1 Tax=Tieghemiomyces parasiticus TaxID=78921 RepID=A0A9W8A536_9FUNG|nr:hypothetical protein IWQ60_006039 [Tieghemiomyces parasiticus]